jgi:glycosyltransferase involved in cell wall biosynthesis
MNPKVSIMMPAKNEGSYIAEAIQSIVNQTYANWELIIVDDKSSDNTRKIANRFASQDARIKVIDGDGVCAANARNKAICVASGAYIMNMDADDISGPDRITKLLAAASHYKFPVVGSNVLYTTSDLNPIKKSRLPLTNIQIRAGFKRTFNRMTIMPGTFLTTKQLLIMYPYNEQCRILEDWDLILRLSEDNKVVFENIEESLYVYRRTAGSETMNYKPRIQYNIFLRYNEFQRRHKKTELNTIEELHQTIQKNFALKSIYYTVFFLKMIQHGFFLIKVKLKLK